MSGMIVHSTKHTRAPMRNSRAVTVRKILEGHSAGKYVIKRGTCVIRFGMHQKQAGGDQAPVSDRSAASISLSLMSVKKVIFAKNGCPALAPANFVYV